MIPKKSQNNLIVHPIRQRIFGALAGRQLTTEQIAKLLDDIPPATLYRHIGVMIEGGLIAVVDEQRQRGRTMRVLALKEGAGLLAREAINPNSIKANTQAVNTFLTGLMATYASAVRDPATSPSDWRLVGYRAELSSKEEQALVKAIHSLLDKACQNPLAPHRRRRLLSFGVLPDRALPEDT
jgi:DNA-binding transcriptional ArsR family regulator